MKNKIPKDLNPSKIKNYICPVCEKKIMLKKIFFSNQFIRMEVFLVIIISNVVNVIHYIL